MSCKRSRERCPAAFVKSLSRVAGSVSRSRLRCRCRDVPQAFAQRLCPFRTVVGVFRAAHRFDRLIQQHVVGTAEAAAALLQRLADRVDRQMPTDLLVDYGAHEAARDAPTCLGRQQVGIRELRQLFLEFGLAACNDVGQLVVDQEEDEGNRFDGLGEEKSERGQGSLLG